MLPDNDEIASSVQSSASQRRPLSKPKFKIIIEEVVKKTKRKSKLLAVKPKVKDYHMMLTNQPRLLLQTPPSEKKNTQYIKDILLYSGIKCLGVKKTQF